MRGLNHASSVPTAVKEIAYGHCDLNCLAKCVARRCNYAICSSPGQHGLSAFALTDFTAAVSARNVRVGIAVR